MRSAKVQFAIAAALFFVCSIASSQPGIDGYRQQSEFNQLRELRELEKWRMIQQLEGERLRQAPLIEERSRAANLTKFTNFAKELCVSDFSNNKDRRDVLLQAGITVGQLCGCIEQEIPSLLTVDMLNNLDASMRAAAGDTSRFESSQAWKDYWNRYVTALQGCGQQLARKN